MRPLVLVGPIPPPANGVSVMTDMLRRAVAGTGRRVLHLDTSDPRSVHNVGTFDYQNVRLGLLHALQFAGLLLRAPGAAVYVPISQSRWGFVRDAVFLLLARLLRRPRIVHLHGGYFATFYREADPLLRVVIRAAIGGAAQGWVLTPSLRGMFAGLLPDERVHVLENAVDDAGAPAHEAAGDDRTVEVLYLSNLVPEKGCFALLDAVERLGDDARGLRVTLAGDAPAGVDDEVERRTAALRARGVEADWIGTVGGGQRNELMARADVFAFPSTYLYEGQPLVLLEAMAAGLAIVTTAHSGIPDTVRDGVDGVVVPPDAPDALFHALERLVADAAERARLGAAARARWQEQYSPPRFGADVSELLDRLPS